MSESSALSETPTKVVERGKQAVFYIIHVYMTYWEPPTDILICYSTFYNTHTGNLEL